MASRPNILLITSDQQRAEDGRHACSPGPRPPGRAVGCPTAGEPGGPARREAAAPPPREPASRLAFFYILTSTPLEFNMSHSPPLSERARLLRVLCRVLLAQLLLPPQVVHGISPVTISTHGKHIGGRAHHTT
jgi:hypothetical protein